jgi:hypothetical protein
VASCCLILLDVLPLPEAAPYCPPRTGGAARSQEGLSLCVVLACVAVPAPGEKPALPQVGASWAGWIMSARVRV